MAIIFRTLKRLNALAGVTAFQKAGCLTLFHWTDFGRVFLRSGRLLIYGFMMVHELME